MKTRLLLALALAISLPVSAQRIYETNVYVETIAGSGFRGYLDGQGTFTMFSWASRLVVDNQTNVYVFDGWPHAGQGNNRIRKISPSYAVTTFLGDGTDPQFHRDGNGTNATVAQVWSMAYDKTNRVYLAQGSYIRRFNSAADLHTLRTGGGGYQDGPLSNALFHGYLGLSFDPVGNLVVADGTSHRVRKIDTSNMVSTLAGSGNGEVVDGQGIFSSFYYPKFSAVDPAGNIYIADGSYGAGDQFIRKILPDGTVTTLAGKRGSSQVDIDGTGTNAVFWPITGMVVDSLGNIYVSTEQSIRKVTPSGMVTTVEAKGAGGVAIDRAGRLYVGRDTVIDRITFGPVPTNNAISLGRYAGVTISGPIGSRHRIEYSDDMNTGPQGWIPAETITLTTSPHLWIDVQSTNRPHRFYRAVILP